MERLCIYPKDIKVITGRSKKYGRKLIRKMKEAFCKQDHQFITIEEFCNYIGLTFIDVQKKIRN